MQAQINNGKDSYLHCSVDCEVSNYQDKYNSSEECFRDLKDEIVEDCEEREYNIEETEKVLSHYEILINNANGKWEDKY